MNQFIAIIHFLFQNYIFIWKLFISKRFIFKVLIKQANKTQDMFY